MHTVFAGTFKNDDLKGIHNGKRHVRLTPTDSKHDLPHHIQFPGDGRFFNVMWAEKIVNCKECLSDHMLSVTCDDAMAQRNKCPDEEENVSQTKSPVQVMGPSDPEVVTKPSIPPVDHDIDTQTEMPDNPMVPGLEGSAHATGPVTTRPRTWEEIPDKVPSDSEHILSALPERDACIDDSNRDNAASLVPAIDTGTEPGCNDALASSNKVNSQVFPNGEVRSSDPISKSDDSLNATATAEATKLSSRTGDKGP